MNSQPHNSYQDFALHARAQIARFERDCKPVNTDLYPPFCETWEERQERFAEIRSQREKEVKL